MTPERRAELLPCPFCGGDAAIDTMRNYRSISNGALKQGVTIYCGSCAAEMMHCYEDHPGTDQGDLRADLVVAWNRRAFLDATEPVADGEVADTAARLKLLAKYNEPAVWKALIEAAALIERQAREITRLRNAVSNTNDDICQTLGRALGYPKFCDDQKNFPGATDANGVCVGEHVAESIAVEAARRIEDQARAALRRLAGEQGE